MQPQSDGRASRLWMARCERGWTCQDAVDKIRAICSETTGSACRLNVVKLHDYEDGTRNPGPSHLAALCRLYGKPPLELGLTVRPDEQGEAER